MTNKPLHERKISELRKKASEILKEGLLSKPETIVEYNIAEKDLKQWAIAIIKHLESMEKNLNVKGMQTTESMTTVFLKHRFELTEEDFKQLSG